MSIGCMPSATPSFVSVSTSLRLPMRVLSNSPVLISSSRLIGCPRFWFVDLSQVLVVALRFLPAFRMTIVNASDSGSEILHYVQNDKRLVFAGVLAGCDDFF